jgi:eIF3 subunit M, C-terminal helix
VLSLSLPSSVSDAINVTAPANVAVWTSRLTRVPAALSRCHNIKCNKVSAWLLCDEINMLPAVSYDMVLPSAGGTISITRCNHRAFGPEQWRELRDRLGAWAVSAPHVCCANVSASCVMPCTHPWSLRRSSTVLLIAIILLMHQQGQQWVFSSTATWSQYSRPVDRSQHHRRIGHMHLIVCAGD